MARVTVERESKELNAMQEDLARHMGKKPKTPKWSNQLMFDEVSNWLVYLVFKLWKRLETVVT